MNGGPSKNVFKNASGAQYLRGLFYETTLADKSTVVYTLKNEDHLGYRSLYRMYMESGDLTEYKFAVQALDGWDHWEALTQCSWFKPYIDAWRRELEIKVRSQALAKISAMASTVTSEKLLPLSFQANKYLLDGGWKTGDNRKAGRPSKQAIKEEATRIASVDKQLTADFDRIMNRAN